MKYLIVIVLFINGIVEVALSQQPLLKHEMVFVEGGTFQMGCNVEGRGANPIHTVKLNSFNIGKFEVTQAQWKAVMGNNPSVFPDCENCPVENVSWNDVQLYLQELNSQTGKNYRLPTEAEWEYAAKGGRSKMGYIYSGSNDFNTVAWLKKIGRGKTHVVGGKQANELGVCDMSGNVSEFCSDWLGDYNGYNETNPTGASSGQFRVLRGGSWDDDAKDSLLAFRFGSYPEGFSSFIGFRLVLPVE